MNRSQRSPNCRAGMLPAPTVAVPGRWVARGVSIRLAVVLLLLGAGTPSGWAQVTAAAGRGRDVRPVVIWPPGPLEVIAAFDRPVDPALATLFVGRTIPYFEGPAPAAAPVQSLPLQPSGALRIVAARLVDDRRTLVLATDPHPRVARYLLSIPAVRRDPGSKPLDEAAVAYDLTGVEAAWSERNDPAGKPRWSGWWPHLDVEVTRRLTRGSKPHEAGLALLSRPGRLALSTLIHLPAGTVGLRVDATGPIEEAWLGDVRADATNPSPGNKAHATVMTVESQGAPLFLTITARTAGDGRPFSLQASYHVAGEKSDHPLERDRLMVPWAPVMTDAALAAPLAVPDLSGGDPTRGRAIFAGDQARCAQCHTFQGQGGKVGPDLTEIGRKGRAEIYRDIAAPSAAIEPEYTSYTVATQSGQVLVGVVRAEGADAIRVTDTNAHATIVRRGELQEIRPSATSIMPPALASALGNAAVRDLIAFLTAPRPEPVRP